MATDLAAAAFVALRNAFFDPTGTPVEFYLDDKLNTQDDPFDRYVFKVLCDGAEPGVTCVSAPGPLVSPDMALVRPTLVSGRKRVELREDSTALVAIEVKKLERGPNGRVGRASGLDYNSTPPCGTIRAYDGGGSPVDMRGFYLFVCLERGSQPKHHKVTAMVLCDGDALNADFKYYLDITGERTKDIGVGTYGDGANRVRPMVIFANPLGAARLDRCATLIHRLEDFADVSLTRVGTISRTVALTREVATFTCFRHPNDAITAPFHELDPFPTAQNRSERTAGRGRFSLGVRVGS